MPDMNPEEWQAIKAERARIFRPAWFADLLAGRLGLGDTFWIGNYGVALIFVPAILLVNVLLVNFAPGVVGPVLAVLVGLVGLYKLALLRAVWITAGRTPEVGGWRWAGVAITAVDVAATLAFAVVLLNPSA